MISGPASSVAPPRISYQGLILNADGTPRLGSATLSIAIWDAATDGTLLYEEIHIGVPLAEGVFGLEIGAGTGTAGGTFSSLDEDVFSDADRFLEVSVDGERLTPRQQLGSVGYAFQSQVAQRAETAGDADTVDGLHASDLDQSADLANEARTRDRGDQALGAQISQLEARLATHEAVATFACRGGAEILFVAPSRLEVVCDHPSNSVCEEDFESLCPAGWGLCSPLQHNNRNAGWSDVPNPAAFGEIYCRAISGAGHYRISGIPLGDAAPLNCAAGSARPGCPSPFGCNETISSALCCAPSLTCGNGAVDSPEEECDDGNLDETDDCLNSCSFRVPTDHGLSGPACL